MDVVENLRLSRGFNKSDHKQNTGRLKLPLDVNETILKRKSKTKRSLAASEIAAIVQAVKKDHFSYSVTAKIFGIKRSLVQRILSGIKNDQKFV